MKRKPPHDGGLKEVRGGEGKGELGGGSWHQMSWLVPSWEGGGVSVQAGIYKVIKRSLYSRHLIQKPEEICRRPNARGL